MNELYIYGNTGASNTIIGTNTLSSLTSGIDNTAFGDSVFPNLTTGDGNSGFGTSIGDNAMGNPSFSTAIGTDAMKNITTAQAVSAYGYQALTALTTGKNNTAIGSGAGTTITTALDNTLLGKNANVVDTMTTRSVAIGENTVTSGNSVVIGNNSQSLSTSTTAYNIVIGNGTIANAASVDSIIIGSGSGIGTNDGVVIIGHGIAGLFGGNTVTNSVIMGNRAAENIQDSFEDVIAGHLAAGDVDFSQKNVIIGVEAGRTPVPDTTLLSPLEYVVSIGYQAGMQNSAPGNIFIGSQAGLNTTTQTEIVAVGSQALKYVEGSFNTVVGYEAMLGVNTVSIGAINNVAVGAQSLKNITTGSNNVAVGRNAGLTITTGSDNVFIGHSADGSATLNNSVVAGVGASATGNDSVVIGFGASSTAAGGIAIGHSASVTSADSVQIGQPTVSGVDVMRFRTQIIADESWVAGGTSEVTIDDSGNINRGLAVGQTLMTTDGVAHTLATYSVPSGSAHRIETLLLAKRTNGTNEIFSVRMDGVGKNDGTTVTSNTVQEVQANEGGYALAYTVSGTDILVEVTGVAGHNVTWQAEIRDFLIQ